MRRREFITLLGGAAASWPLAARAQQVMKNASHRGPFTGPLRTSRSNAQHAQRVLEGPHELGYAEGQSVAIERQYAEGSPDRLPELTDALCRRKIVIIVAFSTTAARPAKQATSTIPIVAVGMADSSLRRASS
jgi:putative ABC transport system substrate-binding protein